MALLEADSTNNFSSRLHLIQSKNLFTANSQETGRSPAEMLPIFSPQLQIILVLTPLLAPGLSRLYLLILLLMCQMESMLVIEGSNLPVELCLVNRIALIGGSSSNRGREHDRTVITTLF